MDGSDGLVVGCMLILFLTLNIKLNFAKFKFAFGFFIDFPILELATS